MANLEKAREKLLWILAVSWSMALIKRMVSLHEVIQGIPVVAAKALVFHKTAVSKTSITEPGSNC